MTFASGRKGLERPNSTLDLNIYWDRRCSACINGSFHDGIPHDTLIDRKIRPERKALVIAFRRKLFSPWFGVGERL